MNVLQQLWTDESGYILSAEAALLGTVGVVGATVGLSAVSEAVNEELKEVAFAFRSLDQSYCIEGQSGCGAWTAGSSFIQQDVEVSRAELGEWIEDREQASDEEDAHHHHEHPPHKDARPHNDRGASLDAKRLEQRRKEFEQRRRQQQQMQRKRMERNERPETKDDKPKAKKGESKKDKSKSPKKD